MSEAVPVNLMAFDRGQMESFFVDQGEKSFRAQQILKWVYQRGVTDFTLMTDLSKSLREKLTQRACIRMPEVVSQQLSKDGTCKWLFKLADGNSIETVFIPEADRGTLCVSSQAGCALNCTFCATARQGYNRNLTADEIIGQVWAANHLLAELFPEQYGFEPGERAPVTNVVMMGMGEPLLNFDNVVTAMNLMMEDNAFGLSRRRVTLSTAGVVPMIDQLSEQCPVSLAVSLHAPNDELRNLLVPINKKYAIAQLLSACKQYTEGHRQRITFEYVMIDGLNDHLAHADELAGLLVDIPSKVNLIPFNPFPGSGFARSKQANINQFRDRLLSRNIFTVTRKTRGDDIDAACGQLVGNIEDRTKRSQRLAAQKVTIPVDMVH